MSIAEKLVTIAENEQKVYEAGQQAEYDRFWDNYQRNGNRKNYRYAFYGQGWTLETFKPKYDLIVTDNGEFMFANSHIKCDLVELLEDLGVTLDLSKATSISQCLRGTYFTRFGELNFSNKKSLNYVLDQNPYLETIDKLIISDDGTTTFVSTFASDWELKNITFEGVIGQDIDFKNCSKLTHDSLMSIINALKDFRLVNSTYSNVTYEWDGTEGNGEIGKVYETDYIAPNSEYIEFQCSWGDYETNYHVIVLKVRNLNITEEELSKVKTFMIDSNGNLVLGINRGNPTTTKTLTIGDTNLAKLTAEEKAITTNKGWNVV
jgi:hypothetical protein